MKTIHPIARLLILMMPVLIPGTGSADSVFRLGVIQSLTGHAAEDGANILRAIRLAVDDIQKTYPDSIELLVQDDRTDPRSTVSAYQALQTQKLDAILGASWVHTTRSIAPLAERDGMVLFNASCFLETLEIAPETGFLFGNMYSIETDVSTFRRYLKKTAFKKIAILRNSSSWSTRQVVHYRRVAQELGVKLVEEHEAIEIEGNDWRAVLPRIAAQEAEAVVLFLGKSDTDLVLRRAQELKLGLHFFGALHSLDAFRQTASPAAYENFCFSYPYEQLSSHTEFTQRFSAKYGEAPRVYADHAYDATWILFKAFQASQEKGKALADTLRNIEYPGLLGAYRYDHTKSFSAGQSSLLCIAQGVVTVQ